MSKSLTTDAVSRNAHVSHVAGLIVQGNAAAAAMISKPSLMAQDYVPFLEHQAKLHGTTIVDVLGYVSQEDLESTRRQIPKDCPEKARLAEATKALLSTKSTTWTLHDVGQITIAKAPSKFACIIAEPVIDGKVAKHIKGLPFWRFILAMTDADRQRLEDLVDEADANGMK